MQSSAAAKRLAIEVEARADLYFFARYMFKMRRGFRWRHNWHHQAMCDALMKVYRGDTKRLIINVPPRYSKTELAVVNFIAWCIGNAPDCEFIHTSYSAGLAVGNASSAKQVVEDVHYRELFPEVQLRRDSKAKGDWRTTAGGVVYAQGAKGTITGFGAGKQRPGFGGAIIIDDPHKPDEISSPIVREGVIDWFKNTLESRVNDPGNTPIILIMQRLHERDLAGWLLDGGNGETWDHVMLPAINDEGQALWPSMHTIEMLRRLESVKPFEFAGQYQQRPAPRGGAMFQRQWFEIVGEAPADLVYVRDWDLAGTVEKPGTDPDWTVGVKMGRDSRGFHYITDIRRMRGSPHEVERLVLSTAQQDGPQCTVSIKQDPGQAGKAQADAFTRMLAGYPIKRTIETGSKELRAAPFASQCEAGNIKLVRAGWNNPYLDEIEFFPFGRFDDQVDASASAFNILAANSGPAAWMAAMEAVDRLRTPPEQQ
jgi:predicted phage terminase large subunit-like protein